MEHTDDALLLDLPKGVEKVAYADDLALVASGSSVAELEERANVVVERMSGWMRGRGLVLAPRKTEVVVTSKRRYEDQPAIIVDDHEITHAGGISYLRVSVDVRRRFTAHVEGAAMKAAEAVKNVASLMPNAGGPSICKRRMLLAVATS